MYLLLIKHIIFTPIHSTPPQLATLHSLHSFKLTNPGWCLEAIYFINTFPTITTTAPNLQHLSQHPCLPSIMSGNPKPVLPPFIATSILHIVFTNSVHWTGSDWTEKDQTSSCQFIRFSRAISCSCSEWINSMNQKKLVSSSLHSVFHITITTCVATAALITCAACTGIFQGWV